MKQRKFVLIALLVLCSTPVFSFSLSGLAQGNFKQLDVPLIDGIAYFQRAFGSFYTIALSLSTVLGIVCILWNSFRLWMGTQEVRKACVDIITKFLIFIVLINIYPRIVDGVLDSAITIGMYAGDGYNKVNAAFFALREDCESKIEVAEEKLQELVSTSEGSLTLDERAFNTLTKTTFIDDSELESFLETHGVEVITRDEYSRMGNGLWNLLFPTSEQLEAQRKIHQFMRDTNASAALNLAIDKDLQQAMITMRAMEDVMVEMDSDGEPGSGESKVSKYLYNPFMTDENGRQTNMLSPGAMIKTAVLIGDILSRQGSVEYSSEKNGFIEKALDQTFQKILSLILVILMTFGLIMASIFCVIQYIMCIFEYFIVTAVGVIFIPFCLWDGTKSFTAKLVTLFTSYFIKILVMILCLFWVYSTFIYMGVSIISSNEPISFLNFAYFIFACLLGWVVTQNGPQIAVTILNGSPQLSMGEFLHAAGTAAASAVMARKAAGVTAAGLTGGGKAVQAGVRGAQTIDSAFTGSTAAIQAAQKASGGTLTKAQQFGVGLGALGTIVGNGVKNTAATLLTGQEKKEGGISVGGGYSMSNQAKDGSRTHSDSADTAKGMGSQYGEQWAKDNAPKAPEEPDRPTGIEGQRRE
jgi:type IV secretion system protein TrbL